MTPSKETPEASEVGKTFVERQKEMVTKYLNDTKEYVNTEFGLDNACLDGYFDLDTLTETIIHQTLAEVERVVEGEREGLVTMNCYGNCNPRCHDSGKDIVLTTISAKLKERFSK